MTKELLHRIKEFAPINSLLTDEEIKITAEHPYMAVTNPWMDKSGRFELKNSEAVKTWGLSTVVDFCEKMTAAFNEDNLTYTMIEKLYSLPCDGFESLEAYVSEKWGDKTPIERIIKDYFWSNKKGGASDGVKYVLNVKEPSITDCKRAFDSIYEQLKG